MKKNILFNKENLFIAFLFLFSILINQYYGNKGVFPPDSFAHFDPGFRILLGEKPFKDYWIISGPFVDYLQAIFFHLFGVNWQVYVFHASVINGIITLTTFFVLRSFKLNLFYSFAYSLFFSILAYPSSGTPFVDHHSTFFSLLGIYILILAIKSEKLYYWILLPIFFSCAFLSKIVPAIYVIISISLVSLIYLLLKKKYKWIGYVFLSTCSFIFLVLIFGKIQGISLSSFLEQYVFYPQTIGNERFENFKITFTGSVEQFKFIYFSFIPLLYINLKKIFFNKEHFKEKDFFYFLVLMLFTFSLIFHQLLTRNQIYIFFLIPILIAFSHISIKSDKKILSVIFVLFCLFVTTKYHLRFNENRKFHELNYSNFELLRDAKEIDKKFAGLKWITPQYKDNPNKEISLINEMRIYLENDNRNKMVMTNYTFMSVILEKKLFSTTRWHIFDGTDYPQKNSEYFMSYKNLIINKIKNNNIEVIYTINPVTNSNLYDYVNINCFEEKNITEILVSYELKTCKEF